jgi:hypothetical protein
MSETMTMQTSDTLGKFATAMAKAQATMGGAAKDSRNPHFNSAFADLASVVNAVKGPLSTNGIAFVQMPSSTGDLVSVTTRLVHSSGEWMQCTLSARPRKNDPQGVGSVVTYLKRYTLQAMCGVPSEDDDGNAGSREPEPRRPERRPVDTSKAIAAIEAVWTEHYTGTIHAFASSKQWALSALDGDELRDLYRAVGAGTVKGADDLKRAQ